MREVNDFAQFPASWAVAGASFSGGAFRGYWLLDCTGQRFKIVNNTSDQLLFTSIPAPNPGKQATVSGAAWTAGQFANTPQKPSYLLNGDGAVIPILQNTTGALVVVQTFTPSGTLKIVQGNVVQATFPAASVSLGGSWWQIVEADGTAVTDSTVATGAVTVTPGSTTPDVTIPNFSQNFDGRALRSVTANVLLAGSSPSGSVHLYGCNRPDRSSGNAADYQVTGPDQIDPLWADLPLSLDGAPPAVGGVAINDTDAHYVAYNPLLAGGGGEGQFKWYMWGWHPADDPGTGSYQIPYYGRGE